MEKNELTHWGIKGMKWGVRRYQNKDGSLTDAGRRMRAMQGHTKLTYDDNDVKTWANEGDRRRKKVVDELEAGTSKAKRMVDDSIANAKKKTPRMNLDKMTDQEMRNKINRELLERQYNDMFAPKQSTKGREYVSTALKVGGAALSATGTALSIALAVRELQGARPKKDK